jgi:hypothetical protein
MADRLPAGTIRQPDRVPVALAQLNLKLPAEVLEHWRAQAAAQGLSVRDWLVSIAGPTAAPRLGPAGADGLADRLAQVEAAAAELRKEVAELKRARPNRSPQPAPDIALIDDLTPDQITELDRLRNCARQRGYPKAWLSYQASREGKHVKGPAFRPYDKDAAQLPWVFDPNGITGATEIDASHRIFAQFACALLAQRGRLDLGEILTLTAYCKSNFLHQKEIIDSIAASMPGWKFRWSAEPAIELDPAQGKPQAWPGAVAFAEAGAALIAAAQASPAAQGGLDAAQDS